MFWLYLQSLHKLLLQNNPLLLLVSGLVSGIQAFCRLPQNMILMQLHLKRLERKRARLKTHLGVEKEERQRLRYYR